MVTITPKMYEATYRYGKAVYEGKILKQIAADILVNDYGMNPGSAMGYLGIFKLMMTGKKFRQTSFAADEYYLENILIDCDLSKLKSALQSIKYNMDYKISINKTTDGRLPLYNKYLGILETSSQVLSTDEGTDAPEDLKGTDAPEDIKGTDAPDVLEESDITRKWSPWYLLLLAFLAFLAFLNIVYSDVLEGY